MLVRRRFPSGARACHWRSCRPRSGQQTARPAQIEQLAHHARGEPPARRKDAPRCCREAAPFSQRNLREGEAPYRDPARLIDRSLVLIRPEASGLLDRRQLALLGLRAKPALLSFRGQRWRASVGARPAGHDWLAPRSDPILTFVYFVVYSGPAFDAASAPQNRGRAPGMPSDAISLRRMASLKCFPARSCCPSLP